MFFKYWLTLNECAKFINKHFNLFDENQVTENDIIDLALDERIELAIRVKYVDNNQFQTYSSELKINSSLTRLDGIQDNSVEYTIYSGDDSVMECINGEFYAKGIYKIIITESLFLDDTVIFQAIGIIDKENSEVVNFSSDTYPPSTIFFENKIELLKSSLLVQSRQLTDLITEIEIQNSKFI
ncbi:TPA: hypothetical protein RJ191_001088, partial [Mannheimia haemolytica]|nr:hypothetical protein [Mannheimia haemolytica]